MAATYIPGLESYLEYNGLFLHKRDSDQVAGITNLVINPSFRDSDLTMWSANSQNVSSGPTLTQSFDTQIKDSVGSITAVLNGSQPSYIGFSVATASRMVCSPGDTVAATITSRAITAPSISGVRHQLVIGFYNSGGSFISESIVDNYTTYDTSVVMLDGVATAPALTAKFSIFLRCYNPTGTGTMTVVGTRASAVLNSYPGYFDGDSRNCIWTGTEQLSTSRMYYTTKNSEVYRITGLDGISGADIRDDRDANPGAHGETAFNAFYGGRTITIEGKIEAQNIKRLREMTVALQGAFNGLVELPLIMHMEDQEDDVYINCRITAPIAIKEEQSDSKSQRAFMITLRASDPRFYSSTQNLYETDPNSTSYLARSYNRTYDLRYTYYIDANNNIVSTPGAQLLNNQGNFQSLPKFRIYGPCLNPVISNLTTGISMVTSISLSSSDEYIEIDTANKSIVDQSGANRFSVLSASSEWIYLAPGANDIRFVVASYSVGCKLQVYYRSAFL